MRCGLSSTKTELGPAILFLMTLNANSPIIVGLTVENIVNTTAVDSRTVATVGGTGVQHCTGLPHRNDKHCISSLETTANSGRTTSCHCCRWEQCKLTSLCAL